jgi:hypothetical protein
MRMYLDCYPCFLRQGLEASRLLDVDESKQKPVLDRVLDMLTQVELSSRPPQIAEQVHRLMRLLLVLLGAGKVRGSRRRSGCSGGQHRAAAGRRV